MVEVFFEQNILILALLMLWVLPWKGYALWTAANRSQKWWFIILLVVNTLVILDIIYIFFVAKKGKTLFGKNFAVPVKIVDREKEKRASQSNQE